uniref:NADH-ubiquinone oxidoreductase chain 5 n=1 Tax=Rathkea octopunctata TaxID=367925 RepID=A0A0S2IAW0_9CNID|nr:NADH dehydrogenase subunit 5 [Rathkea octopunctata]
MIYLVIILPLLSFLICSLLGRKIGDNGSKIISVLCLLISFLFSLLIFKNVFIEMNTSFIFITSWFNIGLLNVSYGLQVDSIVSGMLILVTGVSTLVHLYSTSYMDGDPHLRRFMSYLSLFTFFMLVLITSSNLVQLFIGWEGVGLCSYLLINFWFTRIQANKAGIKAMVINKVGDIGVLLSLSLIWGICGTLDYNSLTSLFSLGLVQEDLMNWCSFLLFIGVIGKSAQIGLHMWLPDAMEGPTPVSALIHAATMVTAGVFLIIRISPLFEQTPTILIIVVLMGSLTAFFTSTIGLAQNDLKKVIAYSTCSQLGYMVMICGFSHYNSSLFHLINHGFFKALLFLSAGSIIHAVANEQDFRKMGALRFILPLSFTCIIIGSASLMGLPFLTGFYSKDLILELIYGEFYLSFALWLGLIAASLTAFYSFRLVYFTFLEFNQSSFKGFKKAHEGAWNLITPLLVLVVLSILGGYFLEHFLIKDVFPVMLPDINKSLPLFISLGAASLALLWGWKMYTIWQPLTIKLTMIINSLLCGAWYFDVFTNKMFVQPTLRLGFFTTYKLIDNQFLEEFGPTKMLNVLSSGSSFLSRIHLGRMSLYSFLLVLFIGFILIQF